MSEIANTSSGTQVEDLRTTASTANISQVATVEEPSAVESAGDSNLTDDRADNAFQAPPRTSLTAEVSAGRDPLEIAANALEAALPGGEFPPNTTLRIEQDEESGRFVYQSVDNETGEVVRQFPPEDFLEILSSFREPEGVVVDDLA